MLYSEIKTSATKTFIKDRLQVKAYATRDEMGKAVSKEVASKIQEILNVKDEVNMIFASAPSQEEFIKYLI
ncbi:MAG: glucosamine-6-phosphate deaminase, partial [Paludibacter sp.]|nr:glucosamine-6-phosphate deaminase [Paludibacter sp.]